jgi:hypothetical protein
MANIKSFNLVGIGEQVQFGKGGLQIAQDSGAFAFRDPTNTTLVNVEVATPTSASHATSMAYVEGLIDSLTASQIAFNNSVANIAGNPTTVQAALADIAATVATNTANGTQYIRDNNATPTAQVSTDEVTGKVTIDVGGTAGTPANIATFQGGAASNSALVFDNSVAGAVSIDAFSSVASDVNVYINPQGNGKVYIGNGSSDSELQADDGQDLTLAGGDNSTLNGNGGNLILKAGHATDGGTDGQVVVQDGNGNNVAVFGETASADTYTTITNGVGKTTIGVGSSETNANLVLAPLGTGAIQVSGASIQDVATPVNATDAVNKAYVDTAQQLQH